MRNFVFMVFFEIVVVTQASNQRSVNVALETVLEFNSKDDVDFIDSMQKFLGKLKTAIVRNKAENDQGNKQLETEEKRFIFTNFLTETMTVLRSYKDEDLKRFFNILNMEVKTWQTRKRFREISDKLGFRRLIDRNLENMKNSPAIEIRRKLNTISDNLHFVDRNGNRDFVANFLNYFYKKESQANLLNFLNNLKIYRSGSRSNNKIDLKRIIRHGILTIMHPLLKLNSNGLPDINTIYYKFIRNKSDTNHQYDLHTKNKENKPKITGQKYKIHNENAILDYIDDHKRIIEKHLTITGSIKEKKLKRLTTPYQVHKNKHAHSEQLQNRNLRIKQFSLGTRKRKYQKRFTVQESKNIRIVDSIEERKPILIKLGNDNTELKSLDKQQLSTAKQQNQHKKSTRRKLTPKKVNFYLKTTKKFRKAFRPTTLSAEGLSIEHFGSLFGREFHRKSNINDTFVQNVLNSTVPPEFNNSSVIPEFNNATLLSEATNNFPLEMRRKSNLSLDNQEYNLENQDEIKNTPESFEENINYSKSLDNKQYVMSDSIKIKGNIVIENPTIVTTPNKLVITSSKPVNNTTKYRNFNVSIVTKYFNIKPIKPTVIMRQQDVDTSNDTYANIHKTSTELEKKITIAETINVTANEPEIDKINMKTRNRLENEIEGIMDKFNATTIPAAIQNFVKGVQMYSGENTKVKNQMQADLAKLFAPPTTKTTVTELFTDPFKDIDDDADII